MSRPVFMTHLAPRSCKSPIISCNSAGIGGFSNSANSVPSKSVEISFIGEHMFVLRNCVLRIAFMDRGAPLYGIRNTEYAFMPLAPEHNHGLRSIVKPRLHVLAP